MVIKGQQAFKNAFRQALIVSLTPVLPLPDITSKARIHFNRGFSANYLPGPHLVNVIDSATVFTVPAGGKDVVMPCSSFRL